MHTELHAHTEACLGCALMTAPVWHMILADLNAILTFVALLTGAVIGVHGVYRIVRSRIRTGHW